MLNFCRFCHVWDEEKCIQWNLSIADMLYSGHLSVADISLQLTPLSGTNYFELCSNPYTVCDKEDQVQSMQSILVNEFNQSALMQMKNLIENYWVTWYEGLSGPLDALPQTVYIAPLRSGNLSIVDNFFENLWCPLLRGFTAFKDIIMKIYFHASINLLFVIQRLGNENRWMRLFQRNFYIQNSQNSETSY